MLLHQMPFAQLGILLHDQPVGVAGGKMLVIQDPHGHTALFGLPQNHFTDPPPALAGEILVDARLQTDGLDATLGDSIKLVDHQRLLLPVHPKKGQQVVAALSDLYVLEPVIHSVYPPHFDLNDYMAPLIHERSALGSVTSPDRCNFPFRSC